MVNKGKRIAKLFISVFTVAVLFVCIYIGKNQSEKEESTFKISEVQQCIWGKWKITEMHYGGMGWQECEDDVKNVCMEFYSDHITYDGQVAEVMNYTNEFLAIEDENALFHGIKYRDLGFQGNYYIKFYPEYVDMGENECPFYFFVLQSDTKMIILSGRTMYRAEKIGEVEEKNPLKLSCSNSMCYGMWEVIKNTGEDRDKKIQN